MGQLKHDITLEMGNQKQRPQPAAEEDPKPSPEEALKMRRWRKISRSEYGSRCFRIASIRHS
jgi:hypothetical protein